VVLGITLLERPGQSEDDCAVSQLLLQSVSDIIFARLPLATKQHHNPGVLAAGPCHDCLHTRIVYRCCSCLDRFHSYGLYTGLVWYSLIAKSCMGLKSINT